MALKLILNKAQQIAVIGFIINLVLSIVLSFFKVAFYITAPFLMVWIMVWLLGTMPDRKNTDDTDTTDVE